MTELIFATNNAHKVNEVQAAVGNRLKVITLKEAGIEIEIPEPYDTLEDNARGKSRTIHQITGKNCFSEDTGLEVASLNGEPGVKSARYAGEEREPSANTQKLLQRLGGSFDRKARFRTVICLIFDGEEFLFEGICNGSIATAPAGSGGFGYDPIFIPEGNERTFGEMTMEEKSRISHRKKATEKLIDFFSTNLPDVKNG
ncbi:MAG: RdgB/HAM1 family non-canonical purine NTP pyrophosphatase [Chitinophagaceae bacterium]|nr:RdgB/HAM1 family non-canonical purine NTP pyrophosphatase [Chitinophagaceae bacterium]